MIKGHERETFELNKEELWLSNELVDSFKKRGKSNPIKASEIVRSVNTFYPDLKNKFTEVRLRKIINHYRVNSILPIISTSKGYFVSYDKIDVSDMVTSLTQRADSILNCVNGLKSFLD